MNVAICASSKFSLAFNCMSLVFQLALKLLPTSTGSELSTEGQSRTWADWTGKLASSGKFTQA